MSIKPAHQRIRFGTRKRLANFVLCVLAGIFRLFTLFRSRASQNVTVLEPYGLGDVITLEPLIRELKRARLNVVLVANPAWAALYPSGGDLLFLPAQIPWTTYQEKFKYKFGALLSPEFKAFRDALKRHSAGGIGLDTRGDIRSVLLLYLAGCRTVYTLDNYLGSRLEIPAFSARIVPLDDNLTRWQMNLKFGQALGLPAAEFHSPNFAHLHGPQIERKMIALVPIAPWEGKLWQKEKWELLAAELRKIGYEVHALCGPNQESKTSVQVGPNIPITVCHSIEAWANLLRQSTAVVSLDSGPMHLADALQVNVVGLFGQGKLPLWSPGSSHFLAVHHQDDPDFVLLQPVEENTADAKQRMGRISVPEVLTAIQSLLQRVPGSPRSPRLN